MAVAAGAKQICQMASTPGTSEGAVPVVIGLTVAEMPTKGDTVSRSTRDIVAPSRVAATESGWYRTLAALSSQSPVPTSQRRRLVGSGNSIMLYVLELLVQVPPLVHCEASIALFIAAILSMLTSVSVRALARHSTFPRPAALVVAVCIAGVTAIGLTQTIGLWKTLLPAYVALLLAMRFVEGILVGIAIRERGRLTHAMIAAGALAAVFLLFDRTTPEVRASLKWAWSAAMALLASNQMVRRIQRDSAVSDIVNTLSLLVLFVAIHLYLPHDKLAWALYMLLFPAGAALGIVRGLSARGISGHR